MINISIEDKVIIDEIIENTIDKSLNDCLPLKGDYCALDSADIKLIFEEIVEKIANRYNISISSELPITKVTGFC